MNDAAGPASSLPCPLYTEGTVMASEVEQPDARRGAIVGYFAANALFAAGLFAHAFLYNFYLEALGLGEGAMGIAAAALTAGGLAALVPAGLITDRYGPATTFLAAAAVCATGLALGGVLETPAAVYAAAAVAGLGTAAWRVSMGPLLLALAPGPLRSRVFSWNVALLVGSGAAWTAVAGAIPGWIEGATGLGGASAFRGALLAGAALTAASVLPFLPAARLLRTRRRVLPATPRHGLLAGLRIPAGLVRGVLAVFLWMFAGGLVIPFFNLYFRRVHELSVARIGGLFAVAQAATAVALLVSGEAAGRLGPRRVLVVWTVLFAPVLWLLPLAHALPLALALFFVQGLVPPATNPLIDQVLLERAPAGREGAVSSWRNAATESSGLAGAALGGVLLEASDFGVLFAAAGGVAAAGAVALVLWLRAQSGQTPGPPPARSETRRRTMR
jgi:MFS family permease